MSFFCFCRPERDAARGQSAPMRPALGQLTSPTHTTRSPLVALTSTFLEPLLLCFPASLEILLATIRIVKAFRIPLHPSAWIHLHPLAHSHVMTRQSASCVAHRQRDHFSHAPPSAPPSRAPAPLGRHQCSTGSSLLGPILCRPTAASACRARLATFQRAPQARPHLRQHPKDAISALSAAKAVEGLLAGWVNAPYIDGIPLRQPFALGVRLALFFQ